jgi:hypothetical protein
MTLSEQRRLFAKNLAELIDFIYARGDECEIEEVKRSQAQANQNAQTGAGISNSLHVIGLAADLSLFVNGEFHSDADAYRPLADYWTSLHPLNRWGGDFAKPDADHFSSERSGVK